VTRTLRSLLLCCAIAVPAVPVAAWSPPVAAAPGARAAKVNLEMPVVYATTAHDRVDDRLADLSRVLRNLKYTGYELLTLQRAQLGEGERESFTLDGGRKVTVELLSKDDKAARVRVLIDGVKGQRLLDTTVRVNRNGTFIVAGPKMREGILVLPLTARY